jgi:hypothetical protein
LLIERLTREEKRQSRLNAGEGEEKEGEVPIGALVQRIHSASPL